MRGAVVPDHNIGSVQAFKKTLGVAELCLVGAVQTDDEAVQIGDLGQLIQNGGHRFGFPAGIEARQDQRSFLRVFAKVSKLRRSFRPCERGRCAGLVRVRDFPF